MDPFIEGQSWQDFHTTFLTVIREMLTPRVRPRYIVKVQQHVYLAYGEKSPDRAIEPDLSVLRGDQGPPAGSGNLEGTTATMMPAIHTVPLPRRYRQTFLTIRSRESQEVVTVLELLSPWNKEAGKGRSKYLAKRAKVLLTPANLVELDLLRGGRRLPTREPLEPADFYAFVCRKEELPQVEVYRWTLRDRLPTIPVPLANDDPDVPLDLQQAFTTTYDRAGYDYALDYRLPVEPPLEAALSDWVRSLVKSTP
jgi:hypothetical protein